MPINISINNLEVGNYTFLFEASDGWGEEVIDEVLVVSQKTNHWLDNLFKSLLGLGIATSVVLISVIIVYIIKRKNR